MDVPKNEIFTPVKQGKLTELVVSQIKDLIFSKGIDVGEKLPSERDLAERLKISRSAVREALNSLEHAGLVEIKRGRAAGAYVVDNLHKPFYQSTMDLLRSGKIGMQQFLEARVAVECFSVRMAAERITEEDLRRLEAINEDLKNGPSEVARLIENNSLFHVTLAELSGNYLIMMMLQSLMRLMADMGFTSSNPASFIKSAHQSHARIIEALRLKDLDQCEQFLASNIELSKKLRRSGGVGQKR
jgi:GntR family transcriptional regulator, transcriptional repressor for pyruvate dehydrogenase complex